jgi:general secretion pathway protein H
MPTSATGTSTNSPRNAHGFTLVEILVVLVIIGILSASALLSLGVLGRDRQLDTERDRLSALSTLVREQAGMQSREYGLRCFLGGYEFVVFDDRAGAWTRITDDRTLRRRKLPPGLSMLLKVEGKAVVLPKPDATDPAPQIMLFSSGELNVFELTVTRDGTNEGFIMAPGGNDDSIKLTNLEPVAK